MAFVLASSLSCWAATANAQTTEQDAHTFFERGLAASRAQQWLEAHDDFERSLALEPHVSTYFNLAVVCLRLGRGRATLLALDAFEQRADPRTHEEFLSDSVALRARALNLTGMLELSIVPAHAAVYVDQEDQPLVASTRHEIALDPGAHELTLHAEGFTSQVIDFNVDVGQRIEASVSLAPLPVPAVAAHDPSAQSAPTLPQPQERRRLHRALLWIGAAAVVIGVAVATTITLTRDADPAYASGSTHTLFNPP